MVASAKIRVKFNNIPRLQRAAPEKADAVLGALATEGERYAKANMTVSPSSPGEFPGVDTGTLKNSIRAERTGALRWLLTDGTEYGVYLEFGTRRGLAPRPFFGPTAVYLSEQVEAFFREFLP